MATRKAGRQTNTKTGIQYLAELLSFCCCLAFPVFQARSESLGGLLALSNINFTSNQVVVDSFDSSDPTKSLWQTNLFYNGSNYGTYTNSLRTADAMVGTAGGYLVNVSEAVIYGYVNTAPGYGGPLFINGSFGDLAWIGPDPNNPINSDIQFGHQKADMAMSFNDVVLPTPTNDYYSTPTWLTPGYFASGTNIGGIKYYYSITNITGTPGTPANKIYYSLNPAADKARILINASNVVLYLTNGISMKLGDVLTLNTNSSVEIYLGGPFDAGQGLVNNLTQYGPACKIYGLSTCTSITFGAHSVLTTWLYAPEASLTFTGGGKIANDVVGSFLCHDLTVTGGFRFHFDEALANDDPLEITALSPQLGAHVGSNVTFQVFTTGGLPKNYSWFFNDQSHLVASSTNSSLSLTNVQFSDAGDYLVVITNLLGSATGETSLIVYTDATPVMSVPFIPKNGVFQCNVTGVVGLLYTVQVSTNLVDWTPLLTRASPFSLVDATTNLPQRFYRSVYPPSEIVGR